MPSVTITTPTGGDITGESVTVSWTASDADNDPLNFIVEYSTDNGTTWKVASLRTNDTSIEISAANLPQSTQVRFRVWVSDGIHTSSDISNIIIKPNSPPTAVITGPETGSTFVVSQTIGLVAQAFDIDTGSMTSDQLSWTSNLDGALGNGEQLSVSDLSTGVHTITFTADDGVGSLMTDQIQISIVDTFAELPSVDSLIVGPNTLLFDSRFDWGNDLLSIENANGLNAINWNMSASESWIQLGANSGVTPDDVSIAIDMSSLEEGTHTANVTVTSPDVIDQTITIPVQVVIEPNKLYLPLVFAM